MQAFGPPFAQALQAVDVAKHPQQHLIAIAQGRQAFRGQWPKFGIGREVVQAGLLKLDLARRNVQLLVLVLPPELQPAGEGAQTPLGLPQGFCTAALVNGKAQLPHGALDVSTFQHQPQHARRRVGRLQLRFAD